MTPIIVRIALRYASGALIAKGLLDQSTGDAIMNDPDIQLALGAALGAASEGWYYIARKFGWAK